MIFGSQKVIKRYVLLCIVPVAFTLFSFIGDKTLTIYTIGDSTMANYQEDRFPLTGWAQVLSYYFDRKTIINNHASSGRSTKSFISEGRWATVYQSLKPNDYVFIQFGHNDIKVNDSTRYTDPNTLYKENLQKFVNETRSKGAIPILFTSIARRAFNNDGILNDHTLDAYLSTVKEVSDSMGVIMVDMNKLTTDFINKLGAEDSKAIYFWVDPNDRYPEGKKDNTHLSYDGAHAFAKLVLRNLLVQKIDIKDHVKERLLD